MDLLHELGSKATLSYYDISRDASFGMADVLWPDAIPAGKKQLALLYLDGSIDSVSCLWSFLHAGHAVALLSDQLNPLFKQRLEATYQPRYIFDPRRQVPSGYVSRTTPFAPFFERETTSEDALIAPELCVLLSTSGTTGSPKLVKLSAANVVRNAQQIAAYLPLRSDDTTPLNLPISYAYGLSILTSNALAGTTIACSVKNLLDRQYWLDFRSLGFTSIAGTPELYQFLEALGFLDWTLPSLRYLTQAGGRLDPRLVQRFGTYAAGHGKQFFVMYGQTEATARMSFLAPDQTLSHPDSIGCAIHGGAFSIEPGTGELLYRGPNVFHGYATNRAELATMEDVPVLHTGDIARADDEGRFYITGRLKRFVKIHGVRINLDEMEQELRNAFAPTSFYCTQHEDSQMLIAQHGQPVAEQDLTTHLQQELSIQPTALKLLRITEVPQTPNGKVDYAALAPTEHTSTP